MRIKKLAKPVLIFTCVIIYCYSAIKTNEAKNLGINIDMDKPLSVVWPCEVSIVGDMGEKGLRIAPKIGRGWLGEAGGEASYKFYVPRDGKYHIWMHCLWFDECSNAIFAKIDDLDKAIIGNDPIYNQWHWVRGFDLMMAKGTHTLLLLNHSDHISVQKILFTSSATMTPEDCSLVFSDIFYEGFDGCDEGNFSNWQIISGKWLVQNFTEQPHLFENDLIGKSESEAFIMYEGNSWSNYSFNIDIKPTESKDPNAAIGICFGVVDKDHYYQLKWHFLDEINKARFKISTKAGKEVSILANFEILWTPDQWHTIEITLNPDTIIVAADKFRPVEVPVNSKIIGGIGLSLEGEMTAYFDNIHIRKIGEI
ncbi:family 16 glycoside hydrolase [Planctomycetota bacterium]